MYDSLLQLSHEIMVVQKQLMQYNTYGCVEAFLLIGVLEEEIQYLEWYV